MRRWPSAFFGMLACHAFALADSPSWQAQEIDNHVGNVCYAVTTADVNGDQKPDIVAVTEDAVVWFENPSWSKHDIIRGVTERDNVCIAAHDIDADGRVDFALGAGWRPPDTLKASTLQWLGRDANDTWQVYPIRFEEPSIHRIRWGDVLGTGKPQLVVVPLQGRGTKGPNWGEGQGVKVLAFSVPTDPKSESWPATVLSDTLHTIHGFQLMNLDMDDQLEVLLAAWEGVFVSDRQDGNPAAPRKIGAGFQTNDPGNKGASEVKRGKRKDGSFVIATIEPWHGNQVVVYTPKDPPDDKAAWDRHVVAEGVTWGHAVWFADVDLDGSDELIVGQRDPRVDTLPPKGPGVWVYDLDQWVRGERAHGITKQILDDGGMACEDALAADLDGDGRPDIVAGGRATHNVKIYWNRPAPRAKP